MAESHVHPSVESIEQSPHQSDIEGRKRTGVVVWALASVVFLAYLGFGSVEARMWNFGRLRFEDRGILHIWDYFGHHLPSMTAQPIFTALYYTAVGVMVSGTVWGLWFFLAEDDVSPDETTTAGDRSANHG